MSTALKLYQEDEKLSRKPPLGEKMAKPRLVWENPNLSHGTHKEKPKVKPESSYGRVLYNYFRDYDPTTGRYTQEDPIGLGGGLNTYRYGFSNPLRYTDPLGLETTVVCRPIKVRGVSGTGLVHCAVFVWHWEVDGCGNKIKVIDGQYSVAGTQTPQTGRPHETTYRDDRDAFNNPGGINDHYPIPPPLGMNQQDFDNAVMQAGTNYNSGEPYRPFLGPNSNTAADNIVEQAGGTMPDILGAIQQNYGEPIDTNIAP